MQGSSLGENLLPLTTAQKVKDMIRDKEMKPGDRLPSEGELAEMFSVSRSTVREAMKYLKAESVIEINRGSGTFVSDRLGVGEDPLGLSFVNQTKLLQHLFEVRLLIEPQVAMLAAERAEKRNLETLDSIVTEMQKLDRNDNTATELDIKFHKALAECTGNEVLHRVVPIINESIVRGRRETLQVSGSYERAKRSHAVIYRAVRDRDLMTARYAAERHIWETLNDIKELEDET